MLQHLLQRTSLLNCDYMSTGRGGASMDVPCLRRFYMMVEYIMYVLDMTGNNDTTELLAIGGPAEVSCANSRVHVSSRLRSNDHSVEVVACG